MRTSAGRNWETKDIKESTHFIKEAEINLFFTRNEEILGVPDFVRVKFVEIN